jgi:hypothetical protein
LTFAFAVVVAWLRDLVGLSPAFIACPKPQDEPSYRLKPAKGKGVRGLFESYRSHGWFLPRPLLALKQILTGVGCPSEKAKSRRSTGLRVVAPAGCPCCSRINLHSAHQA